MNAMVSFGLGAGIIVCLGYAVSRLHAPAPPLVVARLQAGPVRPALFGEPIAVGIGPQMAVSPDGSVVALRNQGLKLIDKNSAVQPKPLEHSGGACELSFTADNQRLIASMVDGGISVWDVKSGKRIARLKDGNDVGWCLAVSADGRFAAVGSDRREIEIWDVKAGKRIAAAHPEQGIQEKLTVHVQNGNERDHEVETSDYRISSLAFSPNGHFLASGGGGSRYIRIWNAKTGDLSRDIDANGSGNLIWSKDSKKVFSILPLRVWDASTGKTVAEPYYNLMTLADGTRGVPGVEQPIAVGDNGDLVWLHAAGSVERYPIGGRQVIGPSLANWISRAPQSGDWAIGPHARFLARIQGTEGQLMVWSLADGRVDWSRSIGNLNVFASNSGRVPLFHGITAVHAR